MKILVCGAGIAGLTLGLSLQRLGYEPHIIEQAPGLRAGGYMIDFFGSGFDAAEKLALLPELERIHYPIARLSFLNSAGNKKFSVPYTILRKRLFQNRHFNFLRGDLERVLHAQIEGRVDLRFATTIHAIQDLSKEVRVTLSDGSKETYDLLVGADGVHSHVRRLVFGDEFLFNRFLGFHTAAFTLDRAPRGVRSTESFDTLTLPDRQVAVYPIRGGQLSTFFVHRAERPAGNLSREAALLELRDRYGDMGWIVPDLLREASSAPDLYFDDVAQIEVAHWSSGRVVLLGDACQCVSLLAGQGASMAMAGAYVLAEALHAESSIQQALQRYEQRLKPSIRNKQAAGRKMAAWFVPRSSFRIMIRDAALRLSVWPGTSYFVRNSVAGDSIFRD